MWVWCHVLVRYRIAAEQKHACPSKKGLPEATHQPLGALFDYYWDYRSTTLDKMLENLNGKYLFCCPFARLTKNRRRHFESVEPARLPVLTERRNLLSSPTGPAEHWAGGSRAKSFNSWQTNHRWVNQFLFKVGVKPTAATLATGESGPRRRERNVLKQVPGWTTAQWGHLHSCVTGFCGG